MAREDLVGQFFETSNGIVKVIGVSKESKKVIVRFQDEYGYETEVTTDNLINKKSVFNPYRKTQNGTCIGTLGNKTIPSKKTIIYKIWFDLMDYATDKEFTIQEDLKCYAIFLEHVKEVEGYKDWVHDNTYRLVIRKGSETVKFESLLFISEETWQNEYKQTGGQDTKPVLAYIYNVDGKRFDAKFNGVTECARSLGYKQAGVSTAKRRGHTVGGGTRSENGWRIVELEDLRKLKEGEELEKNKESNYYKELDKLYKELESDNEFFEKLYEFLGELEE